MIKLGCYIFQLCFKHWAQAMSLTDILAWDIKNSGVTDNIQTGIGRAVGPVTTSTPRVQGS